jgi:hypothetical protein
LDCAGAAEVDAYDEETHAEDAYEDNLLFQGKSGVEEHWERNGEHEGVGADVETGLSLSVVFECCTLR